MANADNSNSDNVLPPPTYKAPTQFNIGLLRTSKPLVNLSQVKGHLALLHAFTELKKQVEGLEETAVPHMPVDPERRWAWFVSLAVERSVSMYFIFFHVLFYVFLLQIWYLVFRIAIVGCAWKVGNNSSTDRCYDGTWSWFLNIKCMSMYRW